jgi:hypothetical protein
MISDTVKNDFKNHNIPGVSSIFRKVQTEAKAKEAYAAFRKRKLHLKIVTKFTALPKML